MPMFSIAKLGLGVVRIPVMLEIPQNMLYQNVKCLQVQNVWRRLPTVSQFLQHKWELVYQSLDIL